MESLLLLCDAVLIVVVVLFAVRDDRAPGVARRSPFAIDPVAAAVPPIAGPAVPVRRRP